MFVGLAGFVGCDGEGANLVSVHELLADHILADAGGRHQIVKLVEELDAALMVLRRSFTELVPQDQSHTLGNKFGGQLR